MSSKDYLIAFEKQVADAFETGQIHAPVHLGGGNENQLIEIFREVRPQDWVFSTWRSHYHALLKGIPADWLKAEILAGRSMYIMNKEHKFFSSSIMGGILPIALGMALGIKRQGLDEKVWCFVGDMCAESGIYHEVWNYAWNWNLPMIFVVEDNGLSTNTPTKIVWGKNGETHRKGFRMKYSYTYKRTWPHVGVGKWIQFG